MAEGASHIDASTFQHQIGLLAETIAQKVKRDGHTCISAPSYTYADLYILLRQARFTYDFLFFVNADERRLTDPHWNQEYTFVCAPLVRSLIDDLFNVKTLIDDPWEKGPQFRKSGYRKVLLDLDEDEARYGTEKNWAEYINGKREKVRLDLRRFKFNEIDVLDKKQSPKWPTLGSSLAQDRKSAPDTPAQQFFREFTFGPWREYSSILHGAFEGLLQVGAYFNRDGHLHEDRDFLDSRFPQLMSLHIGRAALLLLCICSEIQLLFRFSGANINERMREAWKALLPLFEAQEIYGKWYEQRLIKLRR